MLNTILAVNKAAASVASSTGAQQASGHDRSSHSDATSGSNAATAAATATTPFNNNEQSQSQQQQQPQPQSRQRPGTSMSRISHVISTQAARSHATLTSTAAAASGMGGESGSEGRNNNSGAGSGSGSGSGAGSASAAMSGARSGGMRNGSRTAAPQSSSSASPSGSAPEQVWSTVRNQLREVVVHWSNNDDTRVYRALQGFEGCFNPLTPQYLAYFAASGGIDIFIRLLCDNRDRPQGLTHFWKSEQAHIYGYIFRVITELLVCCGDIGWYIYDRYPGFFFRLLELCTIKSLSEAALIVLEHLVAVVGPVLEISKVPQLQELIRTESNVTFASLCRVIALLVVPGVMGDQSKTEKRRPEPYPQCLTRMLRIQRVVDSNVLWILGEDKIVERLISLCEVKSDMYHIYQGNRTMAVSIRVGPDGDAPAPAASGNPAIDNAAALRRLLAAENFAEAFAEASRAVNDDRNSLQNFLAAALESQGEIIGRQGNAVVDEAINRMQFGFPQLRANESNTNENDLYSDSEYGDEESESSLDYLDEDDLMPLAAANRQGASGAGARPADSNVEQIMENIADDLQAPHLIDSIDFSWFTGITEVRERWRLNDMVLTVEDDNRAAVLNRTVEEYKEQCSAFLGNLREDTHQQRPHEQVQENEIICGSQGELLFVLHSIMTTFPCCELWKRMTDAKWCRRAVKIFETTFSENMSYIVATQSAMERVVVTDAALKLPRFVPEDSPEYKREEHWQQDGFIADPSAWEKETGGNEYSTSGTSGSSSLDDDNHQHNPDTMRKLELLRMIHEYWNVQDRRELERFSDDDSIAKDSAKLAKLIVESILKETEDPCTESSACHSLQEYLRSFSFGHPKRTSKSSPQSRITERLMSSILENRVYNASRVPAVSGALLPTKRVEAFFTLLGELTKMHNDNLLLLQDYVSGARDLSFLNNLKSSDDDVPSNERTVESADAKRKLFRNPPLSRTEHEPFASVMMRRIARYGKESTFFVRSLLVSLTPNVCAPVNFIWKPLDWSKVGTLAELTDAKNVLVGDTRKVDVVTGQLSRFMYLRGITRRLVVALEDKELRRGLTTDGTPFEKQRAAPMVSKAAELILDAPHRIPREKRAFPKLLNEEDHKLLRGERGLSAVGVPERLMAPYKSQLQISESGGYYGVDISKLEPLSSAMLGKPSKLVFDMISPLNAELIENSDKLCAVTTSILVFIRAAKLEGEAGIHRVLKDLKAYVMRPMHKWRCERVDRIVTESVLHEEEEADEDASSSSPSSSDSWETATTVASDAEDGGDDDDRDRSHPTVLKGGPGALAKDSIVVEVEPHYKTLPFHRQESEHFHHDAAGRPLDDDVDDEEAEEHANSQGEQKEKEDGQTDHGRMTLEVMWDTGAREELMKHHGGTGAAVAAYSRSSSTASLFKTNYNYWKDDDSDDQFSCPSEDDPIEWETRLRRIMASAVEKRARSNASPSPSETHSISDATSKDNSEEDDYDDASHQYIPEICDGNCNANRNTHLQCITFLLYGVCSPPSAVVDYYSSFGGCFYRSLYRLLWLWLGHYGASQSYIETLFFYTEVPFAEYKEIVLFLLNVLPQYFLKLPK